MNSYDETAASRGRRTKRILAGEGMLTPSQTFVWRGDTYTAGQTRVAVDHEVTRSEFAHLLTPAYEKEAGLRIIEFLERVRGRKGQRRGSILPQRDCLSSWSKGSAPWRLGPPSWKLGR